MTAVTRTRLDRCSTKDCPYPNDREWHEAWMERCANAIEHGHRHDQPTHAHFPKKGMGGNNPLSKIVAIICWPLHDSVDNGENGMGVALGEVRFWDIHNNTILRGPSQDGASTATGDATRGRALEKPAIVLVASRVPATSPVAADVSSSEPPQDARAASREFDPPAATTGSSVHNPAQTERPD